MSRGSLDTEDSLNRLFTEHGEALSGGDMRELLVLSPLDLMLSSTIMIVVSGGRSILKGLGVVDFLSLGEPGSGWLSPSMVVLKELVIEVILNLVFRVSNLVISGRNVALLLKVLRANLGDVKVYHVAVVSIDVLELLFSQFSNIEVLFHRNVLVR